MLLLKVTASRAPPGHSYTARSGSALYRYRSCAGTFILLHRGTPLQRPAEIQPQFRDHGRLLTLTRQAAAPQAMQARTIICCGTHITIARAIGSAAPAGPRHPHAATVAVFSGRELVGRYRAFGTVAHGLALAPDGSIFLAEMGPDMLIRLVPVS